MLKELLEEVMFCQNTTRWYGELAQMVERALSMGEVEGSMPSFSNRKLIRVMSCFGSWCRELLHTMASDKVLLWPALQDPILS